MEIYGQHYGGPASGIWCERCRRAGHQVKMCPAREPRRFNRLCDTCCWLGHLSCYCLLQRDRIHSDEPTQPFPAHLYRLRHTVVAAAAPAMIYRVLRRSTVVVIAIVRNRSYNATAAATVQHCRRSSSKPHAPSLALSGVRGTTAATVQRRSSSQPHAPALALSGTRGTTAATVQRHSSSQPHAPSLALSGTRGTTAATVQRRRSSQPHAPSLALSGTRGTTAATV